MEVLWDNMDWGSALRLMEALNQDGRKFWFKMVGGSGLRKMDFLWVTMVGGSGLR